MVLKVLKVAEKEIGYFEKASNDWLDQKNTNIGKNNWTKYARDLDNLVNFYNGKKNGYPWCDIFVDWCFFEAYGREWCQKLLNQPNKSAGAGCTYSLEYFKQINRFFTKNPQPGDQIFFGRIGNSTHTGLIERVDDKYIYTIEGNTSSAAGVIPNGGCVCRKKYLINSSSIAGFGRPDYSLVGEKVEYITYNNLEEEEEEVTQEQFNEMMNNYLLELAKQTPSSWSAEARNWCEQNGIINGDETGNRMYKKFLTREEMAAIVYRLHGKK